VGLSKLEPPLGGHLRPPALRVEIHFMKPKDKVCVISLGCAKNLVDSEHLLGGSQRRNILSWEDWRKRTLPSSTLAGFSGLPLKKLSAPSSKCPKGRGKGNCASFMSSAVLCSGTVQTEKGNAEVDGGRSRGDPSDHGTPPAAQSQGSALLHQQTHVSS